jgi:hypothetical protein
MGASSTTEPLSRPQRWNNVPLKVTPRDWEQGNEVHPRKRKPSHERWDRDPPEELHSASSSGRWIRQLGEVRSSIWSTVHTLLTSSLRWNVLVSEMSLGFHGSAGFGQTRRPRVMPSSTKAPSSTAAVPPSLPPRSRILPRSSTSGSSEAAVAPTPNTSPKSRLPAPHDADQHRRLPCRTRYLIPKIPPRAFITLAMLLP